MVNEKGLVKILDIGLAKLAEEPGYDAATATQTMGPRTEEGAIVGTVAYMSVGASGRQKGRCAVRHSSFGSLLYEMVTGRRAFDGQNKVSTLPAILHAEPAGVSQAGILRYSSNGRTELRNLVADWGGSMGR